MIEVTNLRKSYGKLEALRGISFSIQRGEVVGLLGPNGAGKTTAMKILVGYLLPNDGRVTVAGFDVTVDPLAVQQRIGYLPENAPLYHDMLVQEYLSFCADMRGLDRAHGRRRIALVVDECAIGNVLTRPIGHLSKGYRQRVGFAAALLHDPEILIMDEPTSGLDPDQIVHVRDLIRQLGRTKTVILSTHILSEVEATCGRAVIIIDGQVRADGTLDELTRAREEVVTVRVDDVGSAGATLEAIPGVSGVRSETAGDGFTTFRLALRGEAPIGEALAEVARDKGWALRELRRDERSMEQVFRELTATRAGEEVAA